MKSKAKDTFSMPPFVLERKENKKIFIYLLITTERNRRKVRRQQNFGLRADDGLG